MATNVSGCTRKRKSSSPFELKETVCRKSSQSMNSELIYQRFQSGAAHAVSSGSARQLSRQTYTNKLRSGTKTGRRLQLIVNADDFGISEEVNESVVRAFKYGVLTSCSLMVTGPAFDQAVKLAKDNPKLSVGIHVVSVMGKSVLSKSEIPTLVDEEKNF